MSKPIVAVTMGDPSGIGPEVVVKAARDAAVRRACRVVIVGDAALLQRAHAPRWPNRESGSAAPTDAPVLVESVTCLKPDAVRPGRSTRNGGEASYRYILRAVELIGAGGADAMATAPINKKALNDAGHAWPGHTELLADLTHTREVRMMLYGSRLKVVLVTVHLPLTEVAASLTRRRIRTTIELTHRSLQEWFGLAEPRLAVAALNPHGGEDGMFGQEERRVIRPAVRDCSGRGMCVSGPVPADSLFHRAVAGEFDAVICMYHDQGLGPFKLLHFTDGVNLTLGLPIIRTSVDHGTAYDIAGKGVADPRSMKQAILLAAKLARAREAQPSAAPPPPLDSRFRGNDGEGSGDGGAGRGNGGQS